KPGIIPRLRGIGGFAGRYRVLGANSVIVEWRLRDGSQLRLIANVAAELVSAPDVLEVGRILYTSAEIPGAPQRATFVLLQSWTVRPARVCLRHPGQRSAE